MYRILRPNLVIIARRKGQLIVGLVYRMRVSYLQVLLPVEIQAQARGSFVLSDLRVLERREDRQEN